MPLSHSQNFEGFGYGGAGGPIGHCQPQKRKIDGYGDATHEDSDDFRCEPQGSFPKRLCLHLPQESQLYSQETLPGCLNDSPSPSSPLLPSSPSACVSTTSILSSSFMASSLPQSLTSPLPRNLASNNLANHFLSRMRQNQEEEKGVGSGPAHQELHCSSHEDDEMNMEEEQELLSAQTVGSTDHSSSCSIRTSEDRDISSHNQDMGSELMDSYTAMDSDCVPDSSQYTPGTSSKPISVPQSTDRQWRGLKPSPVSGRLHCHCSASWRGMYGLDNTYVNDYY